MIIDTYCLVFTLRLIMRLIAINFLIARLIAIKNFNRTAALVSSRKNHLVLQNEAIWTTEFHLFRVSSIEFTSTVSS